MSLLEIRDIHVYYGNIHALKGVSVNVEEGEIVSLIGGNGAGKTSTLRAVSGLLRPRQGSIVFAGENICACPPHTMASRGIAMAPEGRGIFSKLSVQENLEMGAFHRNDKASIREDMDKAYTLFPRLGERHKQVAGTMSGGEQQMLAIARALMVRPKLLLLDEPSMGLAPVLVETIFETIVRINQEGATILLVEQNAHMALQIAHRGFVLQTGEIVLCDTCDALQQNAMVQKAYLGVE